MSPSTLALLAEMEGMKITNLERESHGMAYAYGEDAFQALADRARALTNAPSGLVALALGRLRVACAQIAPSDDAIISEHLRAALAALEIAVSP